MTGRRPRLGALLLAVVAGVGLVPASSSSAQPGASGGGSTSDVSVAPGYVTGPDGVGVLAQTSWVGSGHVFHMRLRVSAHNPPREQLGVYAYPRLTTRTGFDQALLGRYSSKSSYFPVVDVSRLTPDSAGGVDVDIPVNMPATGNELPRFDAFNSSGVFPLRIGLYEDGVAQGSFLTTFLVYSGGPPSVTGLPRLSVAVVVPVHATPTVDARGAINPLSSDQSQALSDLVGALVTHPEVATSLAVTPQTLDALGAPGSSPTDKATLNALVGLTRSSQDQVLPSLYSAVPVTGMLAAGLGDELSRQFTSGSSTAAVLAGPPSAATWVVNGPMDRSSLRTLTANGAAQLIVPDADLSTLPASSTLTTFATPAQLDEGNDTIIPVYGADTALSSDFDNPGGPVLAATQLLAELAMIQLETPGLTRGVAVLPPQGWRADATFVDTLLAGLSGHPLLQSVTASGLFEAVHGPTVQRDLAAPPNDTSPGGSFGQPAFTAAGATQLAADADSIHSVRGRLVGLSALLRPQDAAKAVTLDRELLTAESTDLTGAERDRLLSALLRAVNGLLGQVTLPKSSSITLTSTKGQIPLTILSEPSLHARVELRLTSQRLIFQAFSPPGGKCRIPKPTSEICDLSLTNQNTTLKVPVQTRSSGVFPLDVLLSTPDGYQLGSIRDTVRSTAVSNVGLILIVVAVLSLAIWWVRDLRHGRRARRLVPAPVDDRDGSTNGAGSPTPARDVVRADAGMVRPGPASSRPTGRHFRRTGPGPGRRPEGPPGDGSGDGQGRP